VEFITEKGYVPERGSMLTKHGFSTRKMGNRMLISKEEKAAHRFRSFKDCLAIIFHGNTSRTPPPPFKFLFMYIKSGGI